MDAAAQETMIRTIAVSTAFIAAAGCGPASERPPAARGAADAPAQRSVSDDSAAVVAVVLAHRTAIASGDGAAVASHHRADLTFFGPESPHFVVVFSGSTEATALWERFGGSTATWRPRDVQVQLFGDVAVAAFFIDGSASYADGVTDTRTRRVTEVWIRSAEGAWQEAHHHESPIESQLSPP
jgi:ketosteroid isomerase-like protein